MGKLLIFLLNMNHGWIWIMGEYDYCVNTNYGWIKIMGGGQTHTYTDTHTDIHINTMNWLGLGAGPSENPKK